MRLILGTFVDQDKPATVDLPTLLETRMLIQANSGNGKSWLLRRLLEITAGHVQQLIVDPEGEFASLREKHDLVICAAKGGDAATHPRTAALLAQRLLETEASAVLDISDLKVPDRHAFVRLFLESLINAPKALRHAVLLALDEAQIFAPEKGQGESEASSAVIDIASRGRKRGLCLVAATQRISMLHKAVAGECKNRLIGGTSLDVDVKRAAFDLGMPPTEALGVLRALDPGHFFAFGPAFKQLAPRELSSGPVETTHPKVGHRQWTAPPKPTAAIVALLPKLADLPKEAEEQARTMEDLRRELTATKRELTQAHKAQPVSTTSAADVRTARNEGFDLGIKAGAQNERKVIVKALDRWQKSLRGQVHEALDVALRSVNLPEELGQEPGSAAIPPGVKTEALRSRVNTASAPPPARSPPRALSVPLAEGITPSQQRILDALAWLEDKGISSPSRATTGAIAHLRHTTGNFKNYLGNLRSAGLIEYPREGEVSLTDTGRKVAHVQDSGGEIHEQWLELVSGAQRRILEAVIQAHPEPISRDQIGEVVGLQPSTGNFKNYLGALRTLGAIDYPQPGHVALTPNVMP